VQAQVVVREDAVLCGRDWFDGVFAALDRNARIEWLFDEGADMQSDSVGCRIRAEPRWARLMVLGALNWSVQWYKPKQGASLDELTEQVMQLFLPRN